MIISKSVSEIREIIFSKKKQGLSIGFAPTMGALHDGHISLIEAANDKCDVTVASIYINPTQFNNAEDLEKYPRDIDNDIQKLKENGCDILFLPSDETMYPEDSKIGFSVKNLDNLMEGAFRPGHFSGVALVVSKLFNIVQPHYAFFGQKDFQQQLIIRQLVKDLFFETQIINVPIKREASGLAMSSRNGRLTSTQLEEATILYKSLTKARQHILDGKPLSKVKSEIKNDFYQSPVQLEYFEILENTELKAVENISNAEEVVLFIAAYVGNIRLIDNMYLIS